MKNTWHQLESDTNASHIGVRATATTIEHPLDLDFNRYSQLREDLQQIHQLVTETKRWSRAAALGKPNPLCGWLAASLLLNVVLAIGGVAAGYHLREIVPQQPARQPSNTTVGLGVAFPAAVDGAIAEKQRALASAPDK